MSLHKLPLNKISPLKIFSRIFSDKNKQKDFSFIEWFVGFTDAEGNFTIGIDSRGKFTRFNFRFMIGLHIDDQPVLEFIQSKLKCGRIEQNKEKTASYFIISDVASLKSVLIPIFESFPLNTSKHLDYLSFKEALLLEVGGSEDRDRLDYTNKVLSIKNSMNKNRREFTLPIGHVRVTLSWILGFIEGDGSFHLRRNTLTPTFSLTLTLSQMPIILEIISYLKLQLDEFSLIKANDTKLFNIRIEKSRGNENSKVNFAIFQIDYLMNIFIPLLDSLPFQTKKRLDFLDFKIITSLIYQGKHLLPEVQSFILQLSHSMNNNRLSTNLNISNILEGDSLELQNLKETYLNLTPIYGENKEGVIVNLQTGEIIRDTFVVQVEKLDNTVSIFPNIVNVANAFNVSRPSIYESLANGKSLREKGILNIKKIRVYKN